MNNQSISATLNERLGLNQTSKVLVIGLGETGFSVAKFLQQQAIPFAVTDSRSKPPFNEVLLRDYPDIAVFTGEFDRAAFEVATHLIVSPGVSLDEPSIQSAVLLGIKVLSDIDLFSCATEQPIVAITGSNGKSTVTTMLGEMGNKAGVKTAIGGNLGVPALDLLDKSIDLYVLELSSFQLERTSHLKPVVATVLNISADHLDRYESVEKYAKEKQTVFSGKGAMVINEDDPIVKAMARNDRDILFFSVNKKTGFHIENHDGESWLMNGSKPLMRRAELTLDGLHNVANALAALALGTSVGLEYTDMCTALKEFKGLNHRMQKVAKVKGVTWVNDSKATNVGACIAALQSYKEKIILIAGGDAKGADMSELIPAIIEKVKHIVLLGKDADVIDNAIHGSIPSHRVKTIQEAVQIAAELAIEGENVVLSPACASLDQYKNYQERGEKFTAAVLRLAA